MEERKSRIGLNEAVFREVNERIEQLSETFGLDQEPLDLICECGDASCVQRITMSHSEYESLREEPRQFAVSSGHEIPDVERIVEQRGGYDVVEKREGAPAQVARATDPRGDD